MFSIVVTATEAKDFLVASDKLRVAKQLSLVGIAMPAILLFILTTHKDSRVQDRTVPFTAMFFATCVCI